LNKKKATFNSRLEMLSSLRLWGRAACLGEGRAVAGGMGLLL